MEKIPQKDERYDYKINGEKTGHLFIFIVCGVGALLIMMIILNSGSLTGCRRSLSGYPPDQSHKSIHCLFLNPFSILFS